MDTTWVPQECTLPTPEQPLRIREFDELFAESMRSVDRPAPGRLRMELDATPTTAGRAAHLAARETACCSFFTFTMTVAGGELWLEVSVPPAHTDVLEALAARADA